MPYIPQEDRDRIHEALLDPKKSWVPQNAGELNYVMTRFIDNYLKRHGLRYQHLNDLIGALEMLKPIEFDRIPIRRFFCATGERHEIDHIGKGIDWVALCPRTFGRAITGMIEGSQLSTISAAGVLTCCQMELYRLIAGPYEDQKLAENGPAYTVGAGAPKVTDAKPEPQAARTFVPASAGTAY